MGGDGDAEVVPGVELIRVPGHNRDMMCARLTGGGKTVFFFADLIPTAAHVPFPWIMGYDLYPLRTLETKRTWVARIVQEKWLVAFGHDAEYPAGSLHEHERKVEFVPVDLNS